MWVKVVVFVMVQQYPVAVLSSGSPVEGGGEETAVLPATTTSARDKNDKHLMGAFEDSCFITVGLQTWHGPMKI